MGILLDVKERVGMNGFRCNLVTCGVHYIQHVKIKYFGRNLHGVPSNFYLDVCKMSAVDIIAKFSFIFSFS